MLAIFKHMSNHVRKYEILVWEVIQLWQLVGTGEYKKNIGMRFMSCYVAKKI